MQIRLVIRIVQEKETTINRVHHFFCVVYQMASQNRPVLVCVVCHVANITHTCTNTELRDNGVPKRVAILVRGTTDCIQYFICIVYQLAS